MTTFEQRTFDDLHALIERLSRRIELLEARNTRLDRYFNGLRGRVDDLEDGRPKYADGSQGSWLIR